MGPFGKKHKAGTGRKFKSGTGRNSCIQNGKGGLNEFNRNVPGTPVPTDRTVVPDADIGTHPSSTNAIQILTAPVILTSPAIASTLPRRAVTPIKKRNYFSPFMSSQFWKTDTAISATLEMQPIEYCEFLTSMAKRGSTSRLQLPNLVANIHNDKIIVTIDILTNIYDELQELQGTNLTVSAIIIF
jgi:hypothetical protein